MVWDCEVDEVCEEGVLRQALKTIFHSFLSARKK